MNINAGHFALFILGNDTFAFWVKILLGSVSPKIVARKKKA
jgi:hypothetical protein